MRSHNKHVLALAATIPQVVKVVWLSITLRQVMNQLFLVSQEQYCRTTKPPLFHSYFGGSPKWTPPTPPLHPPGHPSHITSIMHECQLMQWINAKQNNKWCLPPVLPAFSDAAERTNWMLQSVWQNKLFEGGRSTGKMLQRSPEWMLMVFIAC